MTTVHKGLVGVHADTTAVSTVMPDTDSLTYRGYPVENLCESASFEEVAYLLLNDDLPAGDQESGFRSQEIAARVLPPGVLEAVAAFPRGAHPMDSIRTAVSLLGMHDASTDSGEAATRRRAIGLLGAIPTAIAAAYHARHGRPPIAPDPSLGFAANFFHLIFGRVPEPEMVRAFEVSLILYAEHGFNASTFTARVVTSTQADLYGAVTAAIAALKGPLHGGANEAVMHMLTEIGTPENALTWLQGRFEHRALVMGFGHRVYKHGDSRVATMSRHAERMAEITGDRSWLEIGGIVAAEMLARKAIHPNLDFPTGPAYHLMGFETSLFTPIFVASRITGWAAHIIEQARDNRLIRPLSVYDGQPQRAVPPPRERAPQSHAST